MGKNQGFEYRDPLQVRDGILLAIEFDLLFRDGHFGGLDKKNAMQQFMSERGIDLFSDEDVN